MVESTTGAGGLGIGCFAGSLGVGLAEGFGVDCFEDSADVVAAVDLRDTADCVFVAAAAVTVGGEVFFAGACLVDLDAVFATVELEDFAADTFRGGGSDSDSSSLSGGRFRLADGLSSLAAIVAGMSPLPSFLSPDTLSRLFMNSNMSFVTRVLDRISFSVARTSLRICSMADES